MNILIITQRVDKNDANLGFFLEWIYEFSKIYKNVFVISQGKGDYKFPENVSVFSLGKEKNFSKLRQFFNFYKMLFKNFKFTDAVFVHMVPMWAVLAYPLSLIYRKKIYLWYTHKQINFWLKAAEKIVLKIFTASQESCRLNSRKVVVIGHSINTNKFQIPNYGPSGHHPQGDKSQIHPHTKFGCGGKNSNYQNSNYKIVSIGRISRTKNQKIILEALDILVNKRGVKNLKLQIAGQPIMENDFKYLEDLKNFVKEKKLENCVEFLGGVQYNEIDKYYKEADLFINLSGTGSVDKAILEAMACGLNIITSNEAFFDILHSENIIKNPTTETLTEKINFFLTRGKDKRTEFRDYVIENHNLEENIKKMADIINKKNEKIKK